MGTQVCCNIVAPITVFSCVYLPDHSAWQMVRHACMVTSAAQDT